MDYFFLKQDKRHSNTPFMIDIYKKIDKRYINRESAEKIKDTLAIYIKPEKDCRYLDILDRQLYIVSEKLKRLIEKYQPDTVFKTIALIDMENEKQKNYYIPIFEEIEVLSPKSEYSLDGSVVKKAVIDVEKTKGRRIFKIKEGQNTLVAVRLDLAESILRRDFDGISLEKIQTE